MCQAAVLRGLGKAMWMGVLANLPITVSGRRRLVRQDSAPSRSFLLAALRALPSDGCRRHQPSCSGTGSQECFRTRPPYPCQHSCRSTVQVSGSSVDRHRYPGHRSGPSPTGRRRCTPGDRHYRSGLIEFKLVDQTPPLPSALGISTGHLHGGRMPHLCPSPIGMVTSSSRFLLRAGLLVHAESARDT
jgi:hypothetical protein